MKIEDQGCQEMGPSHLSYESLYYDGEEFLNLMIRVAHVFINTPTKSTSLPSLMIDILAWRLLK